MKHDDPRATEKLQKVLAALGLGSRREMEAWIAAGRVTVNGRRAVLGERVGPRDRIAVDGRLLRRDGASRRPRVVLYNKSEGELCTRADPHGRPTVFERLPFLSRGRWVMVGRLDVNSAGLLLFTTHGELAHGLMHPSRGVEREYLVRVHGSVTEQVLARLAEGVELEDGPARFEWVVPVGPQDRANRWFRVGLREGRNREVRRIWESQGLEVSRLKRIRYGGVILPSWVRAGEWVELPPEPVRELCRLAGLDESRFDWRLTAAERERLRRQEARLRARGAVRRAGATGRPGTAR
ncbi:MAG: hypothetical protein KatS3mg124_1116 [Porticoccaceae bacterium]|nr:MAG: hypothetical protein KatS3mg124_1116 [Porticoccaceae bacterium]